MSFIKSKLAKRIALVAIVTIGSGLLWRNVNSTGAGLDGFKLKAKTAATVDKIFISPNDRDQNYLILEKKSKDNWTVSDGKNVYNTDTQYVYRILRWMLPRLQVKNPVPDGAKARVEREMALSANKVMFYNGDKVLHTIYVGKGTPDGYATHMHMPGNDRPSVVEIPGFAGTLTNYFTTDINEWKSAVIIKYPLADIAKLDVQWPNNPNANFTIENDRNGTRINSQGKPLSNVSRTTILTFLNMFQSLSRESGATVGINSQAAEKQKVIDGGVWYKLSITNSKGKTEVLEIFRRPVSSETYSISDRIGSLKDYETDSYFARLNNSKEFFVVQDIVFKKVMKTAQDFIRK